MVGVVGCVVEWPWHGRGLTILGTRQHTLNARNSQLSAPPPPAWKQTPSNSLTPG